jgi:hypothetical protein
MTRAVTTVVFWPLDRTPRSEFMETNLNLASIRTVQGYRLDDREIAYTDAFLFSTVFRLALGLTQLIPLVPGLLPRR